MRDQTFAGTLASRPAFGQGQHRCDSCHPSHTTAYPTSKPCSTIIATGPHTRYISPSDRPLCVWAFRRVLETGCGAEKGWHAWRACICVCLAHRETNFLFVCDPLSSHTRSICLSPRYESLREQSVVWSCWSQHDFAKSLDLVHASIWAVDHVVSHNLILKTMPSGTVSFSCIGCMI